MKLFLPICALFLAACGARGAGGLVIHEWGTLTSLEDETGQPIPGINADDEPVPSFVHEVAPNLLYPPSWRGKGVPGVHPDVTVRLETPVLYVHAPPGFTGPLDVQVKYPAGWLTEFYPAAQADAPGIDPKTGQVGHISGDGTLHWQDLKIGGTLPGPATTDPVWLSPRNVAADNISTPAGESEKFLFYRGVGREGQILAIPRDKKTGTLRAFPRYDYASTPAFWLADIRPDGTAAFQLVAPLASSRPFKEADYSIANISGLRSSLETALIQAGLYKDEAEALLNTWQVSYFKNPGLRAFYLLPRTCVDLLLPLTVSPRADITRVMVGRIELITPQQRAIMARIKISPESAQLFFSLGRFRDALLLDEYRLHPSPGLEQFMQRMSVAFYKPS
jgi:hypothetical protein